MSIGEAARRGSLINTQQTKTQKGYKDMKRAIMMDPKDNVATALVAFAAGDKVEVVSSAQEVLQQVTIKDAIPLGHKIALANIAKDALVIKYGETIGKASRNISAGDYVHIHNVVSIRLPLTEHMLHSK